MSESEHARALLGLIALKLTERGKVDLTHEERSYLADVCAKALSGHADPLRIGKRAGGQSKRAEGLEEARLVHRARLRLGTLRAACEAVGEQLSRDGSKSGAVEKNYKRHREALEAVDRLYAARNARREIDAADIALILGVKAAGK